jgi:hypothetical protein
MIPSNPRPILWGRANPLIYFGKMVLPIGIEPTTPSLPTDRVLFRLGLNKFAEVGFFTMLQSVVGDDWRMRLSL